MLQQEVVNLFQVDAMSRARKAKVNYLCNISKERAAEVPAGSCAIMYAVGVRALFRQTRSHIDAGAERGLVCFKKRFETLVPVAGLVCGLDNVWPTLWSPESGHAGF